jgi:hypothetical protein
MQHHVNIEHGIILVLFTTNFISNYKHLIRLDPIHFIVIKEPPELKKHLLGRVIKLLRLIILKSQFKNLNLCL